MVGVREQVASLPWREQGRFGRAWKESLFLDLSLFRKVRISQLKLEIGLVDEV